MRCAIPLVLALLLFSCEGKDPAGAGKSGKAPAPGPVVAAKNTTPPAPTRDVAAEIAALPAGDLAALVALLADTAEEPRDAWREALPELAAGLTDEETPELLLAAPAGPERIFAELADAWCRLDERRYDEALQGTGSGSRICGEGWLIRAFVHQAKGDAEAARRAIGNAVAEGVPVGLRDVAAGRLFARAGNLKRAEEVLRTAADRRAWGPYAMVLLADGMKPADALSEAEQVFSGGPDDLPSMKTRLMLLTLAGEFDAALAAFAELSAENPKDPSIFELGGDLFALRQEPEPAKAAYLRAIELDPGSALAHRNLAAILFANGEREEGYAHLEAAIATAPKDGVVGLLTEGRGVRSVRWEEALSRQLCGLAVRRLADGGGEEQAKRYLRTAVAVCPTSARPLVILSEMALRSGDLQGAIEVLTEGSRPVSGGEDRFELLLRLAVRKLMAGDREGYAELVAGIPANTPTGRLVARLGAPDPDGLILLEGRPNCPITSREGRFQALAAAVFGPEAVATDRTALLALIAGRGIRPSVHDGFDIPAALKAGTPVLVDRAVLSEDGAEIELALIVGHDPGLGAYLLDAPDPTAAVLIEDARVRGSIFYRMTPEAFTPEDDGKGVALAKAIEHLRKAELSEAFEALPRGVRHPISSFVRSRGALLTGRGTIAEEIIRLELTDSPENAIWHLLYAQTLLVNGEQESARHAVERAAELAHGFQGSVLYRRLIALTLMTPDSAEATISALKDILADRPDYLSVYRDLAGVYISRGRFGDARLVLDELGERHPASREESGYQQAVKNVLVGLGTTASTAEELEPLITSDDKEIRQLVVRVAPRLSFRDAAAVLIRMTRDPDADIRALSLRYIGVKRMSEAAEAVRTACTDESGLVRGAAAQALRAILEREGAADLVAMLADPDPYVREVAVNELKTLSGKEFGFDPRAPEAERTEAARRWAAWVRER